MRHGLLAGECTPARPSLIKRNGSHLSTEGGKIMFILPLVIRQQLGPDKLEKRGDAAKQTSRFAQFALSDEGGAQRRQASGAAAIVTDFPIGAQAFLNARP